MTQETERRASAASTLRKSVSANLALCLAHPAPGELAAVDPRARPPWSVDFAAASQVRLGLAVAPDGASPASNRSPLVVDGSPLIVDAAAGIVCVGNSLYSLSLARAVWMQLAWNIAPEVLVRHSSGHTRSTVTAAGTWPMALVASNDEIPPATRYVIEIMSPDQGHLSDRDDPRHGFQTFIPDYATSAQATAFEKRLDLTSHQIERARPGALLPTLCSLADLFLDVAAHDRRQSPVTRATLLAPIGVGGEGSVSLDLVRHGPHAVVAGMTGTGKTEFLVSWILSMAHHFSPEEFTVLVIDFKGGAGFARAVRLPHWLGVMTDLDVESAQRALLSLRAEMRFRERTLNDSAVTDIQELPPGIALARLVIVVDEYRALLDHFIELQPLFLDIAARGRALGIHLVLGTQRATGVVSDGILANCALRIVFRVNNVNDSMALLVTDDAHTLPAIPGRVAVKGTSLEITHVHVALAREADTLLVHDASRRWRDDHPLWRPRRPWLPPLPEQISLDEVATFPETRPLAPSERAASLILGLQDEPEEQQQNVAYYLPSKDGHVLVDGAQGAAKSTLLHSLAAQAQRHIFFGTDDAEKAWDGIRSVTENTLVLIDDFDSLMAEFTLEHRDIFLESLIAFLRSGPGRGVYVVIASQGTALISAAWMSLMKSRLTLGGAPAGLAGRGLWNSHALHVASPAPAEVPGQQQSRRPGSEVTSGLPLIEWKSGESYVVVTAHSRLRMSQLALGEEPSGLTLVDVGQSGDRPLSSGQHGLGVTELDGLIVTGPGEMPVVAKPEVYVGDVEDWQSQFLLLSRLRAHATFVFDDCSPAEVRAVRRSRDLLPHTRRGGAVSLTREGISTRVRLT